LSAPNVLGKKVEMPTGDLVDFFSALLLLFLQKAKSMFVLPDSPILSRTDISQSDKYYRLKFKIENRLEWLNQKFNLCKSINTNENNQLRMNSLNQTLNNYIQRLDILISKCPTTKFTEYMEIYNKVKNWPDRETHFSDMFNLEAPNYSTMVDKPFPLGLLELSNRNMIYRSTSARIQLEIKHALEKNWFMVFNTLTVNPLHYNEVFKTGSSCWINYIRKIKRHIGAKLYGSKRAAEIMEKQGYSYFEYFAVVEYGGKTGRMHIHVLMFMPVLPRGAVDPNSGIKVPIKSEINTFKQFWPYGYSSPVAVRFGGNDAYGRLAWKWPLDVNLEPRKSSDPGKVAGYLVKYLQKAQKQSIGKDSKTWKSRISHNLGKKQLNQSISLLNPSQLQAIVATKYIAGYRLKVKNIIIPYRLIRKVALKKYVWYLNQNNLLHQSSVCEKTTHIKTLLKSTTPENSIHNWPSFTTTWTAIMKNMVIYENSCQYLVQALTIIENDQVSNSLLPFSAGGNASNYRI